MKIHRFEGIIAWQRVKYLRVSIYTEFCGDKDLIKFSDQFNNRKNFLILTFNSSLRDLLTPFYSPSLSELERGNNGLILITIAPLFFKRKGKGVMWHSHFDRFNHFCIIKIA